MKTSMTVKSQSLSALDLMKDVLNALPITEQQRAILTARIIGSSNHAQTSLRRFGIRSVKVELLSITALGNHLKVDLILKRKRSLVIRLLRAIMWMLSIPFLLISIPFPLLLVFSGPIVYLLWKTGVSGKERFHDDSRELCGYIKSANRQTQDAITDFHIPAARRPVRVGFIA